MLYVNCLKFITDENISDYLQHIKDSVGSAFWEIVQKQLKEVDPHSKLPMRSQVLFNALRVVEAEFDKSLPTNSESIHYYLNNYYLSKMGNQHGYQRDSDSGAFWGKAFLLYRAGRKEKFYKLLENDQTGMLLKEFVEVDQAIARKESKISTVVNATEKDVFYDQLIYALRGEHKFSSSILCSKATLDIVWLLLRTAGIFANSYQYFV